MLGSRRGSGGTTCCAGPAGADLVQVKGNALAWLLAGVSAPTVGAVLATRRPRHPVGWLLLGLGASIGLTGLADGYARYGLLARPGSLPAARWPAIYSPAVAVAGIACLGFVLLTLTPEPLDRAYGSLANPLGLGDPRLPIRTARVASGVTVAGVVVGALSLVVRFRRGPAGPSASSCAG